MKRALAFLLLAAQLMSACNQVEGEPCQQIDLDCADGLKCCIGSGARGYCVTEEEFPECSPPVEDASTPNADEDAGEAN